MFCNLGIIIMQVCGRKGLHLIIRFEWFSLNSIIWRLIIKISFESVHLDLKWNPIILKKTAT